MNNSTVAQLMTQIHAEHEAAKLGLSGIAQGTAQHDFINAHMERLEAMRVALGREVGDDAAMAMMCKVVLSE